MNCVNQVQQSRVTLTVTMPTVKKSILMTDPDVAADKEIADLDAHLIKLAELRAATLAEMEQLCAGSLPHIAHKVEVEAIDRSIRRLQAAKAMWALAKTTRQMVIARR
jgi:hypothetical protein